MSIARQALAEPPKLRGYEFTAKEIGEAAARKSPLIVFLAYNESCNLACPFCFTEGGKRSSEELGEAGKSAKLLNLPELRDLIRQSAELGAKSICIYGEGEPLLDKELLFELLAEIRNRGMSPVVFTNGTLIGKETAQRLFSSGASVVGKLYSLGPGKNEDLTGNRRIYDYAEISGETAPAYIQRLLDAGFGNSGRLALQSVVNRLNLEELPRMWEWERKLGIMPYMDFLYAPHELDIEEAERAEIRRRIWKLDRRLGFGYPLEPSPKLGHRSCDTRPALFISANGFARLCAATYVFVGDARKEPLKRLMEKKLAKERELERCEACSLFCKCYEWNKRREGDLHEHG